MTTKNILCIKWGSKYGGAYVNRLYEGVREHLSGPIRFICLTDDDSGLSSEVKLCHFPLHLLTKQNSIDVRAACHVAESWFISTGPG